MYNPYNFYVSSGNYRQSDEGLLNVSVFGTDESTPIDNAEVKVTESGNTSNVLADEFTDISGETRYCCFASSAFSLFTSSRNRSTSI